MFQGKDPLPPFRRPCTQRSGSKKHNITVF